MSAHAIVRAANSESWPIFDSPRPTHIALHEATPQAASLQKRESHHTAHAFAGHEHGVIASNVVRQPVFDPIAPRPVRTARRPQVHEANKRKRHALPPEHICLNLIHCVPTGSCDQSPDRRKARPPVNLRRAPHMERGLSFELRHDPSAPEYAAGPSGYAQARIGLELPQAVGKKLRTEMKDRHRT
jgi:hypothetical protein